MRKVMVVAPHPDDETLGCGGTLLKHRSNGDEIHWLIITSIEDLSSVDESIKEKRRNEIEEVAKKYKFTSLNELNYETASLDRQPLKEIISSIFSVFQKVKPDIIYIPYMFDPHSDHRIIYDASIAASKSFRSPFISSIRVYQTLSETEFSAEMGEGGFKPSLFIDITNWMEKKLEIMRLYESEFGNHPFPRSEKNIIAQATLCGSSANCEYAEGFIVVREIA
tara:strand:+ start:207 stop:875 length:669 start_codon:yes stop_codon:yes gene_type:complete